jgi:chitin synthase
LSRGTKGDNGSTKDLGGAKKIKGENGQEFMEVEIPTAREDVDQLWAASRSALRTRLPEEKEHRDAATKQADHDRNSRTNVVIAWVGTNMAMILIFTSTAFTNWVDTHVENTDDTTFNPYLTALFIALCVIFLVYLTKLADSFFDRQGRPVCYSFHRLILIFDFPTIRILKFTRSSFTFLFI